MQKLIAEQNYQKERLSGGVIAVLLAVVIVISVVRVFLANWLVESSERLRSLDLQIAEQTMANQTLSEQLREKKSLTAIENQAKALGYNRTAKLTFISLEPSMAANSQVPTLFR